ncbi:aspartate aminotransferase family protein [Planotetraspora thailandica]|nr:aspartate aminotransferase family protein [Planotetraspora thailandica]
MSDSSRNPGPPSGSAELLARHRAVLPNWVNLYYDEPIEIVSGKGNRVVDASGKSYLDFFAGILTNMIGYDVPEVREAVERQLATGIVHTSTLYLIRAQVELAEKIARLSRIPDAKVFFTNSGTEANETALLLATYARKTDQVLAMRQSYHGRSFGAVSVTSNRSWKNNSLSPLNVHFLHGADRHLAQFRGLSDADYIKACVDDLRHVLATAVSNDVAALIAEPIQGVGGFTMAPDGLFAAYKEVLDAEGVLFISDEVQTGWGRTGSAFFGIENHGVVPDMLTFAKGLGNGFAVGGVVARGELMDALHAVGLSTFGGNPISMAAANATLDYVLDHDLQANAARTGDIIIAGLREAEQRLGVVGAVRGRGLMFAIELVDPATGAPAPALAVRFLEETKKLGLLVGKGGLYGNTLRMAPPLTITEDEAREGLGILVTALETLNDEAR